ncbi:MAG: HD domain-containing phosphohydrolase [Acidobacteriota bacterium]
MGFNNSFLLRRSSDVSSASAARRQEPVERGKQGKIVVAESNPSDLEHIASILRGLKFTVLTAQDGKTAWTLIRRHLPLMVLSSLDLPGIDGYKLVQRLREEPDTEAIPFMFIVEGGETPDRLVGHETFAHDYIQKPLSVAEFESRVIGLLNLVRSRASTAERPPRSQSRVSEPEPSKPGEGTPAQRIAPETGAGARAPVQAPEGLAGTVGRMRQLLGQLAECIGHVERRLRLSEALADPGAAGDEAGAPPAVGSRGGEGGAVLSFQAPRGAEGAEASAGNVATRAGFGHEGEIDRGFSRGQALQLLERYRSEYREAAAAVASTQPVSSAAESSERQSPQVPDWRHDSDEEESAAAGGKPSRESTRDQQLEFDGDLLGKLNVNLEEPAGAKIKAEEFTSFARQSFLSAFLDEAERPRKVESLYEEAQDFVLRSIRRAAVGGIPYATRAEALATRLMQSLRTDDELLLEATEREQTFSVSHHSVNVAVLSIRIAQVQGRSAAFQLRVALAALFHEIGVVKLPEKLVFREEPLSESELRTLRKRPLFSARVLQEEFGVVAEIVGQVFERENGLGHPTGLRAEEIRDEAKVIGVADFFEACIHKRPYRSPLTGYQALYELSRDGEFDQSAVRALADAVSLFPFNELLLLSTGEVAKVVGIHSDKLTRPRVRLLFDRDGAALTDGPTIDLAREPERRVVEVLTIDQLAQHRPRG